MYRIGVDAGSKTVKVVLLDEEGKIAHGAYQRHKSDIASTLATVLDEIIWRFGDATGSIAFTGSAGIGIAEAAGIPFVQEVVATTCAVRDLYPQAEAVIELGGEDAKVIYLTDGLEQRMNATCAGGTGGFIDTIAFMLGASAKDMSDLGMAAQHEYPIASRCAVFAQTDVRPLLNAGVRKADIAGSALEAVVRQTLTGLACGRPIKGTVVFAGGPLEHIPDLVHRFRCALGLDRLTGIKPDNAHLLTAAGAAILSCPVEGAHGGDEGAHGGDGGKRCEGKRGEGERCEDEGSGEALGGVTEEEDGEARLRGPKVLALSELRDIIACSHVENDLPRLEPLFSSVEELAAFRKCHRECKVPTIRLYDCKGDLFLGIDAGSTAVKLAVIDECGRLAYSDYRQARGDVLGTTVKMLVDFYRALPSTVEGVPLCNLAHVTATGYGEALLRAGIGVDSGVVETLAHVKAALGIEPELTFLLDIGGQDMKALWVREGVIEDAVLNEACSSGCGSFVEGTAHALKITLDAFGELAAQAQEPLDLGTKCTVFMTSRVRHAQKTGALLQDIAAGIAYSVAKNALFRTIGAEGVSKMGEKVVVQGGAFASDAILRAFELVAGVQALRPDRAPLMGAIGAALTARERNLEAKAAGDVRTHLLSLKELKTFSYTRSARRCNLCSNNCSLSIATFATGGSFVTGNRCSRPVQNFERANREAAGKMVPPNVVSLKQKLLRRYSRYVGAGGRGSVAIGIVTALHAYEKLPFWHTLFSTLGFTVLTPESEGFVEPARCGGMEDTPSESVCFPAKIVHAKVHVLKEAGARYAFLPRYERGSRCPVACEYPSVLGGGALGKRSFGGQLAGGEISGHSFDRGPFVISPVLHEESTSHIGLSEKSRREVFASLQALCLDEICWDEFACAVDLATVAQKTYVETVLRGNDRALSWVRQRGARGVVLVGRPYHADPAVMHSIDRVIQDLGLAVMAPVSFPLAKEMTNRVTGLAGLSLRMEDLASVALEDPALELVVLRSFGCSYDALSATKLREAFERAGKSPIVLKIDDMVDTAHVGIRLRTLFEAVDAKRESDLSSRSEKLALPSESVLPLKPGEIDCVSLSDPRAFLHMSHADIEASRACVKDVCFVAAAMAGRAVRLMVSGDGPPKRLSVPYVCQKCVLDALPDMVERSCGKRPEIMWVADGEELCELYVAPRSDSLDSVRRSNSRPKIGIVGALPLCFDPYLNDGIVEFLESQDCEVALPNSREMAMEDVRYLGQLESYRAEGIRDVIYLQSFGCLKGHVRARGSYRELQKRFPEIRITYIDFDAETSALNRENRLRLAIEQARDDLKMRE